MNAVAELQRDLILAAFAEPERALPAWARWQLHSGWEQDVDFESYLLLPHVYHNLGGHGVDDDLFRRLKGVVKRNWVANAALISTLLSISTRLEQQEVPVLVLPPVSLLLWDRGVVMPAGMTVSIALPRGEAQRAVQSLRDAGWEHLAPGVPGWCLPGYIAAVDSLVLQNEEGCNLELHWSDVLERGMPYSEQMSLREQVLRCPDVTHTIHFLLKEPGMGTDACRLHRALLLLARVPDATGWTVLLQHLRAESSPYLDVVVSLSPTMEKQLQQGLFATESEAEANSPDQMPVYQGPAAGSFFRRLSGHWHDYRAVLGRGYSGGRALQYFPGYMMGKWGLQHPGQIPRKLLHALRYRWQQY